MPLPLEHFWADRDDSLLLVVDVQQRLVPSMPQVIYAGVLQRMRLLVAGAGLLGVPVLTTEQYPKGLGATVPELSVACAGGRIEKLSFGCCGEPSFLPALKEKRRTQIIVTGMEAHVCVYQTVLGLLAAGFRVQLVGDAICSQRKSDFLCARNNASAAGAVVTTAETVLFQWLRTAAAPEFRAVSALIKQC